MEGNDFLSIHQLTHVALHLNTTYFFPRMEGKSYLQSNAAPHPEFALSNLEKA